LIFPTFGFCPDVSYSQPAGRHVYDVNIVATMQAYGIQNLLTNNPGDFAPFASIITILPLQAKV
jgi:predicted nucleic acid-binding protein